MSVNLEIHADRAAALLPEARLLIGDSWTTRGGAGSLEHVNPSTGEVQAEIPLADARRRRRRRRRRGRRSPRMARHPADAPTRAARRARRTDPPVGRRLLDPPHARDRTPAGHRRDRSPSEAPISSTTTAAWRRRPRASSSPSTRPAGSTTWSPSPTASSRSIMTWNGGLSALGRKAGAALAAGNTVVIKPSELAPFQRAALRRVRVGGRLPAGRRQHRARRRRRRAITSCASKLVRKVSFTGGIGAARRIQAAAASAPKPVALELGGKSANIVFADANIEAAARAAASGALVHVGAGLCVADPAAHPVLGARPRPGPGPRGRRRRWCWATRSSRRPSWARSSRADIATGSSG